jgi:SAM-dependent methyltransferase
VITPFNKESIEFFGAESAQMHPDSPNCYFSREFAALSTYLECQIVNDWGVMSFPPIRRSDLTVIDVGAGKGRMTTHLTRIARRCVALEPHKPFYDVLTGRPDLRDAQVYNYSLSEYAQLTTLKFDIAWLSGVFPHLDDGELRSALVDLRSLLAPDGLLINREQASLGEARFRESLLLYERPPELLAQYADDAGFEVLRRRRAYPPNPLALLAALLPLRPLREAILRISYHRLSYPLWGMLARCNIKASRHSSGIGRFVVYLLRKKVSV